MCEERATAEDIRATTPHPVPGSAVDPITLKAVDEVVVTTLVDNVYDALLGGQETVTRAPFAAGTAPEQQFESGTTQVGLMAEHGFSARAGVRTSSTTTTSVPFDTGLSPDAMVTNADRLGIDVSGVNAVVLSHGHFDHAGGLAGLAGQRGTTCMPMVVHPGAWSRRHFSLPGGAHAPNPPPTHPIPQHPPRKPGGLALRYEQEGPGSRSGIRRSGTSYGARLVHRPLLTSIIRWMFAWRAVHSTLPVRHGRHNALMDFIHLFVKGYLSFRVLAVHLHDEGVRGFGAVKIRVVAVTK